MLEHRFHKPVGVMRLRYQAGWISEATSTGDVIMAPAGAAGPSEVCTSLERRVSGLASSDAYPRPTTGGYLHGVGLDGGRHGVGRRARRARRRGGRRGAVELQDALVRGASDHGVFSTIAPPPCRPTEDASLC